MTGGHISHFRFLTLAGSLAGGRGGFKFPNGIIIIWENFQTILSYCRRQKKIWRKKSQETADEKYTKTGNTS